MRREQGWQVTQPGITGLLRSVTFRKRVETEDLVSVPMCPLKALLCPRIRVPS